jgi:hypothetical protein
MLEYLRKIQRPRQNSSLHLTIPKTLCDIISLNKGDTIVCSLASINGEKVISLRKLAAVKTAARPVHEIGVTT